MSFTGRTPLARGPAAVVGYHGCHQDVARRITAGESSFVPSANEYDWLGGGVYFWEYGPLRARQWARSHYGAAGAVLAATITLKRCLNLLDTEHFAGLQRSYEVTVRGLTAVGIAVPQNSGLKHDLDCLVVDSYCLDYAMFFGEEIQSVRGCFPEGRPLFAGSSIQEKTHVQIAVRDESCISDVELVHFP